MHSLYPYPRQQAKSKPQTKKSTALATHNLSESISKRNEESLVSPTKQVRRLTHRAALFSTNLWRLLIGHKHLAPSS